MVKNNIIALVKPTHNCNLNCTYCYDKVEKCGANNEVMTNEMVEKIATLLENAYANVNWTWHGGEPLLIPKEKYIEFHNIINKKKFNKTFCMQTNGTLLNKEWRDILNDLEIYPSISYDFTNKNKNRGHSANIGRLDPMGKYPAINVIDFDSSRFLIDVYETLKNGNRCVSFNKMFLNSEVDDNIVEYVNNWKEYFDHYLYDKDAVREDRFLMSYFNKLFSINSNLRNLCDKANCLNNFISVNPTGNVYHCDRFGDSSASKYCFGNVMNYEFTILEYKESEGYKRMVKDMLSFNEGCYNCEIANICSGMCLANRVDENGLIDLTKRMDAECYFEKEMFKHVFNSIFNLKKENLIYINPIIYEKIFEEKIILKFMIPEIQEGVLDENINFD